MPANASQPRNRAAAAARELHIERSFDAPRSLLYRMWTEPRHLTRWSCPQGFVITHSEGEVRPGGRWRACMRAPDGVEHWVGGVYREVVPDALLVFSHAWEGEGHETLVSVRFEDDGAGTRMRLHQAFFASVESRDGHRDGWSECFERLQALLPEAAAAEAAP